MIIVGIDPGIASVGFGVIKFESNKFTPITYDTFKTAADLTLEKRLVLIFDFLSNLIKEHNADAVSVEELFFNTNVKTAIAVGHARGVILLAAEKQGVPVFEYTPLQVKQAVVGYGRADKNQVQQMVKVLLNLEKVPKPDDTADALAVAICHAHSYHSKLRY